MPQAFQNPPDSKTFTVQDLFSKSAPLVVPQWQRDYSWQPDEHVQKLIDDLWEFNESAGSSSGRYYLLGQVIFVPNGQDKNEIVDGQQRLTTLYLMLLCLYNAFRTEGRVDLRAENNNLTYSFLIDSIVNREREIRIELPFQDGSRVLRHLYSNGSNNREALGMDLTNAQVNLINVYDHVCSWVDEQLPDEESLTSFAMMLLNSVFFNRLVINDIPQAMDYFEKMNRRGLPLAAADLLKNYLFAQLEPSDFAELTDEWRKMSKKIEGIKKRSIASTEMFIKSWAISQHFQKINGTETLLRYWKHELDTKGKRDLFMASLLTKSTLYRSVADGKIEGYEKPVLEHVRNLNGSQHLPVLLAGSKLHNYRYLCELLDNRFTLYAFANERTGAFESMIPKWCEKLVELHANASEEKILEASRSAEGFLRGDATSAISSFLGGLNYRKGANKRKLRFALAITARHLDVEAKADHHDQPLAFYLKTARKNVPGFDMDHILGQQYLDDKSPEEQILFHSIGALTPLFSSAHREQVNLTPSEKAALYEQSPFVLTKSLVNVPPNAGPRLKTVLLSLRNSAPVNLDEWTTESVALRSSLIIDKFLEAIKVGDFLPK